MQTAVKHEVKRMKRLSVLSLAASALALGLSYSTMAQSTATETFVPTTIQYPGSTTTTARGINSNGDIVGSYSCVKNPSHPCTGITPGSHGFLILADTTVYLPIDVPQAGATLPRSISEEGLVVGQYNRTETISGVTGVVTRGFTCTSPCSSPSDYVYPIDVPGALFDAAEMQAGQSSVLHNTLIVGVSPEGDLVGCYHEDNLIMTTMHGWVRHNGAFSELATGRDNFGQPTYDPDTMNNGVSPAGEIVGIYFTSGVSYIADQSGVVETFTFPGNLFTLAWGVNARGDVVGEHGDNQAYSGSMLGMCTTNCFDTNPVGFIRTRFGDYQSLKVEGANSTVVFGINASRNIVGSYVDSVGCGGASCTHGFVHRLPNSNQL
jgi:hypothetical protein